MEKMKKVATLYVYVVSSSNIWDGPSSIIKGLKAFISPNNDFMTSIFETFEGGDGTWGDFEEFETRDSEGGFNKWELKNTLELTKEELESLGMGLKDFKENVNTPLEYLSIKDFEIEYFGEAEYNKLFLDAKSPYYNWEEKLVEQFKDLSNNQLDSLIQALESIKK